MKLKEARKLARSWRDATLKFAGVPTGRIGEIGDALIRLDLEIEARDKATDELIGEVRKVCKTPFGKVSSYLLNRSLELWDDAFDEKLAKAAKVGKV